MSRAGTILPRSGADDGEQSSVLLVVEARDPEGLGHCLALREEVFIREQGVSVADEHDGLDHLCRHFLAWQSDRPVGTARLLFKDGAAKVQRVAVVGDLRGAGVGRALMAAVTVAAKEAGCAQVVLSAQVEAIPFYLRLGFVAEGPEYLDAGIVHRDMRRDLRGDGPTGSGPASKS